MRGARPAWDQVQQPCRGMILPACQVHDAGELTWAPSASVLVMPHVLVNPQHPNPCETGGVIRCGLQARLDMGPHGIPRGCQLSSQASDGGSFEAQLSDRPADRPGPQTRPGCAHPLVMFQERHRLAGVFAAYPSALKPSDTRRDPGPGRVDHLHHHAPVALCDHPTTRAANQLVARLNIEHQSIWGASHAHQMEALQTDEQITPITTIKRRRAAAGRVRHRPRSLTTAGVEVRSSPGTSTSTRNPRSTPGHPHSTRKSRGTGNRSTGWYGCYNQYPATCEDELSNSLLLREKIGLEGVARCPVDVVAVLHDASGGIVCRALRRQQGSTAVLGQKLGLLGGCGTRPDDLSG